VNYFKGRHEVHLENGHSLWIPKLVYYFLAQAAISAEELGGIEPQTLTPHEDGGAGAILFLWGKSGVSLFLSIARLDRLASSFRLVVRMILSPSIARWSAAMPTIAESGISWSASDVGGGRPCQRQLGGL
jgi:hypothetical protein